MSCSVRIKQAWIADGTGGDLFKADVLIVDGRIAAIEPEIIGAAADRTLDFSRAEILAPGFIDVHGHSDVAALVNPGAFAKVSQGVTTEIVGNCGLSAFPVTDANREHLAELYANYGLAPKWRNYREFQAELDRRNVDLRLPALCGHNTLRAAVSGYDTEKLSPTQLIRMTELLAQQLEQGALGLSSGLLYVPGKFADEAELVALMRVLARYDAIYTTHLRSEGAELLEALAETLDFARAAKLRRVHISHFKTAGRANWHKLDEALAMLEAARGEGMLVTVDRYPYTESLTQLSVILPGKWGDLDDGTIQRKLQDKETREALSAELAGSRSPDYWQTVRLVSGNGADPTECGKTLSEISPDPSRKVVELLAADCAGTTAAFSGMSEENLARILALDFCMAGSDGNAFPADYRFGRAHPRAFGAIARFCRRRLDSGSSIPEVVWRLTGLAVQTFQLPEIGVIRPGAPADLVAFDPETIDGNTDFAAPHTPASGISWTMKAGKFVYRG